MILVRFWRVRNPTVQLDRVASADIDGPLAFLTYTGRSDKVRGNCKYNFILLPLFVLLCK